MNPSITQFPLRRAFSLDDICIPHCPTCTCWSGWTRSASLVSSIEDGSSVDNSSVDSSSVDSSSVSRASAVKKTAVFNMSAWANFCEGDTSNTSHRIKNAAAKPLTRRSTTTSLTTKKQEAAHTVRPQPVIEVIPPSIPQYTYQGMKLLQSDVMIFPEQYRVSFKAGQLSQIQSIPIGDDCNPNLWVDTLAPVYSHENLHISISPQLETLTLSNSPLHQKLFEQGRTVMGSRMILGYATADIGNVTLQLPLLDHLQSEHRSLESLKSVTLIPNPDCSQIGVKIVSPERGAKRQTPKMFITDMLFRRRPTIAFLTYQYK